MIVFWPFIFYRILKPLSALKNFILIFIGAKTFVGYANKKYHDLPRLKESVLSCAFNKESEEREKAIHWNYSRDYKVENDIRIIFRSFSYLGNQ
jgi:hypothetical protein